MSFENFENFLFKQNSKSKIMIFNQSTEICLKDIDSLNKCTYIFIYKFTKTLYFSLYNFFTLRMRNYTNSIIFF